MRNIYRRKEKKSAIAETVRMVSKAHFKNVIILSRILSLSANASIHCFDAIMIGFISPENALPASAVS